MNKLLTVGALFLTLSTPAWAAPDTTAPPLVAKDWKLEIVVDKPTILYPSVVCASPDGRVFVGEDYDDMSAPSDATADKIAEIYPDGQVLTFATNLHAVFGMQYIDGKVFVHHTPKFSVFDDFHGEGIHRVDIISNDNPHPWAPSFNDHIPSGFHLAMDGYFYISTGDKGVYNAVGTDGRKISVRGGTYRMRPDGTGLEVYTTGTRNHLDIAINSEDEMFTYDNTDDGGGWWSRVTHMVDGGFYGYPHDFKPQRPYTLWCMADYGAGAATGACCYNEDALPDDYKGNVFMCDWIGLRVMRLKVQREGGTYKIVDRVKDPCEFMTNAGPFHDNGFNFRPVGICVGPDGKSFYVTDWGFGRWKANEEHGRVYKMTYTGKTQEKPKPSWFVAAGTGEPFKATTAELVRGLEHPAQSVRLVAQRRLAERGKEVEREVTALLNDKSAPSYARWSAIWTLDAIDGGKKDRKAIIAALKDKDDSVVMQSARELGTRGVDKAAPALISLLSSTNAAVRFRASTALGRIGDPAAVPALMKGLEQKDLFARYATFLALRRIGEADSKAWPRIVEGLASTNPAIRDGVYFAVRETYDKGLVKALAEFSHKTEVPLTVRTNVFGLLSSLSQEPEPWNGDWWNTMPVNSQLPPKTVHWDGSSIAATALRRAIKDPDPAIRQIGITWIHSSHDPEAAAELADLFKRETNAAARVAILRELSVAATPASRGILTSILKDPHAPADLLQAAIEAAGKINGDEWKQDFVSIASQPQTNEHVLMAVFDVFGEKKMSETVAILAANLSKPSPAVRQHAKDALVHIGGQQATEALIAALGTAQVEDQRQIIEALGKMKAKQALPELIKAAAKPEIHDAAATALTEMPDASALDVYLEGLASKDYGLRGKCETAVRAIRQQAFPLIEAKLAKSDLPSQTISMLRQIYDKDPAAKKSDLFRHKIMEIPISEYQDFALAHTGEARRGKALFYDLKGPACIRCHTINGEGATVGPDLTGIHAKYPRSFIVESVLYPSKQIMDGYQQVNFELKDGDPVSGIVRGENAEEVTVIDSSAVTHVLKTKNIESRKTSKISLMPEGLQIGLSLSEFSDLISYVENPPTTPEPGKPMAAVKPPANGQPTPTRKSAPADVHYGNPGPGADWLTFLNPEEHWTPRTDRPAVENSNPVEPTAPPVPTPPPAPTPHPAPAPPRVATPHPAPGPTPAPSPTPARTPPTPALHQQSSDTNDPPPPPTPPMPPGWKFKPPVPIPGGQ